MEQSAKVDSFVEAIMKESEKKRELIEQETQQIIDKEIAKCESELRRESYNYIQKRTAAIREDVGRDIAEKQLAERRELFLRRAEITDDVFAKAALRLSAFVQTPEYGTFLAESAARLQEKLGKSLIFYIRPADRKVMNDITAKLSAECWFEEDTSIKIGGLKASDVCKKLFADDTLDVRLSSQRDWFMENSGLNIL